MDAAPIKPTSVRLIFSVVVLTLLIGAFCLTLRPFLEALAWATIVAVVLDPAADALDRRSPGRNGRNAAIVVLSVGALACAALLPIVIALLADSEKLTAAATEYLHNRTFHAPSFFSSLPFGESLSDRFERLLNDRDALLSLVKQSQGALLDTIAATVNHLLRSVTTAVFALVFSYFLLRSRHRISAELTLALRSIAGRRAFELLGAVRETVRGSVYGVVATAVAQGLVAGCGYLAAGAPAPVFLGLVTTVFSLVPFGTPLVYTPAAIYLMVSGATVAGFLLLVWGVCVVSLLDNILRPMFISQATQMPMVFSFVGVVGGVIEFGLIGIILGPTIVAVILALWREYVRALETHPAE